VTKELRNSNVKLGRKPILSPTKFATYIECALKYRYVYVDKIGRFFLRARPGYSFGSTLHQALRAFHQDALDEEQLVEKLDSSWISSGYSSPDEEVEHRAAGEEMLRSYAAAALTRGEHERETIWTEKSFRTDLGPFILTGRMDRVDRYPDGALEVIDYKSGRLETTEEEVAADLSMGIYQLILRKTCPGARVFATIYCLKTGARASAEMGDARAAEFESDILALGNEIISRDYENLEPVRIEACDECDFLRKCERFWRYRERAERLD